MLNGFKVPPSAAGRMLELGAAAVAAHGHGGHRWPASVTPAPKHPGLAGLDRRAASMGYRMAVDTSLRPDAAMRHALAGDLVAHLMSIGAYFSRRRACIGLASDSAWHEVVHEMVHLNFDARVHRAAREASAAEPLRLHWEALRRRGHSDRCAEEMVCRAHELRALTTSGGVVDAARALVVWDNMLLEAQRDLANIQPAKRSAAQAAELRRVSLLRSCVTGPHARVVAVVACGLGVASLAAAFVKYLVSPPRSARGDDR